MKKAKDKTPRSQIKSALRKLFLRSRERASALKAESYTCEECNAKQSRAKGKEVYVEVHHVSGNIGNWDKVINLIYEELLCHPDKLHVLCKKCHRQLHEEAICKKN